jgi:sugar phosphate isomerase/epimerase
MTSLLEALAGGVSLPYYRTMEFGICTSVDNAVRAREAGWDFVEELVQPFLQAQVPDSDWTGDQRAAAAALPVPAANSLLPAALKVTGPAVDLEGLKRYMAVVLARAQKTGIKTLVFGSGAARMVPEGFDRDKARAQILDFIRMSADLAAKHGVTLVAEHLNKGECNIINSVAEAMTYVRAAGHPHFKCLVDSWHFWLENEPLESLRAAMPFIRHVHLADTEGRVAPGLSGKCDYRPFFRVLKEGGYAGLISVESPGFIPVPENAAGVLEFVRKQWDEA